MINDKDLVTGRTKYETAIERIKTFCGGKRTLVAFSGGKDSQACYHLCRDAGISFSAQYSITRFEPPELMNFVRKYYPDVTFRRAYKCSLVKQIEKMGLPNRMMRWCCEAKHKKTEGFDIAVIGVRAQESSRRAKNWRGFGRKQDGSWYVCPIIDWSEDEVWEYLNSKGVPHCSLYDEGYRRIGCVCCPLVPSKMRSDAKRYPKIAKMLLAGLRKHWEYSVARGGVTKRGKKMKILDFGTPEQAFEYWLDNGFTAKQSVERDDEPCLFAGTGFSESDKSANED